jgi:hypothetical protein
LRAFYRSGDTEIDQTPIDLSDETVDNDQPNEVMAQQCEFLGTSFETSGKAEHMYAAQNPIAYLEALPTGVM